MEEYIIVFSSIAYGLWVELRILKGYCVGPKVTEESENRSLVDAKRSFRITLNARHAISLALISFLELTSTSVNLHLLACLRRIQT